MRWRIKRWPYNNCHRLARRFLVLPCKIGCEYRWLETALLHQVFKDGKWRDVGWTAEPISELEWAQVSRNEWRAFTPWAVICYKRDVYEIGEKLLETVSPENEELADKRAQIEHMMEEHLPFGKWLGRYHRGRL